MKPTLLHPAYFGTIAQYAVMAQAEALVFENEDNYQKQTNRNRTHIYGANGKLLLSIPIKHSAEGERQLYKDIRIENDFPWQTVHWKSIESAYRTSPFFEYYEDDFIALFTKKKDFLLAFNYECMEVVMECLQMDCSFTKTKQYIDHADSNYLDSRILINAKKAPKFPLEPYVQVFGNKHGYIPNLSILDLLFNEGTNALTYLENQSIL